MARTGKKTVSVRKRSSRRHRPPVPAERDAQGVIDDDLPEEDDAPTEPGHPRRGKLFHVPTPGPVRFFTRARQVAEELPLAGNAFKRLRETEDWALAELKYRLDGMGEMPASEGRPGSMEAPRLKLAALLHDARYNSTDQTRELFYMQALEQLVPEQARMLAVISDGRPTVMCHVDAGPPVGPVSRRVLSFATSAGKDAGVVLRDDVPRLTQHLVQLGLVEEAPEIRNIKAQYELLETEDCVREALRLIKEELRSWPRIQRRSLRLTGFGRRLWQEVGPTAPTVPKAALADPSDPKAH